MEDLTEFQQWAIRLTDKGAGLDASPGALSATQRRECEALVQAGLLERSKNHSRDRYGMFIKATKPPQR